MGSVRISTMRPELVDVCTGDTGSDVPTTHPRKSGMSLYYAMVNSPDQSELPCQQAFPR
jgi:hypothetical protein